MLPRIAFILGFLVTVFGTYAAYDRMDRRAGDTFSFTPPENFHDTQPGVYWHGGEVEDPLEYRELMSLDEGEIPLLATESQRKALYGRGRAMVEDVEFTVVESSMVPIGQSAAIYAKLSGKTRDDVSILIFTWHYPTDRGFATLRGFCLPQEEAAYGPQYITAAKSAKGLAFRRERPVWYVVSGCGLAVGGLLFGLLSMRFKRPIQKQVTRKEVDDEDLPETPGAPNASSAPKE